MKTRSALTVSLTLALLLGSAPCFARSAPASLGEARNVGDSACFRNHNYGGSVMNDCPYAASYHVPLVTDWAGVQTVRVTGKGASAKANVSCQAFAHDNGVDSWVNWSWSPSVTFPRLDVVSMVSLDISIPAHGAAFVDCLVGSGAFLNTVEW